MDTSTQSKAILAILFLVALVAGIKFPDLDLLMPEILKPHSLITHSILLPALVHLVARDAARQWIAAGLYFGIAIHLSAVVLVPVTEGGMVWTPWPAQVPLDFASQPWLAINAVLGVFLALGLVEPVFRLALTGFALVTALVFAYLTHGGILPFIVFGGISAMALGLRQKFSDT